MIREDFPELEPITETGVQVQLHAGNVGIAPLRNRMRYRHRTRNLLMQLSQGIMTVNVLAPYAGWQTMRSDIDRAWQWADEVLHPSGVARIGLRYINFIPLTHSGEKPGDWIAENPYVATAALSSDTGFLSRVEAQSRQGARSIVTVAEAIEQDERFLAIDIDCIRTTVNGEHLTLNGTIDTLHETVWSIFDSFITPRLRALLEGGQS